MSDVLKSLDSVDRKILALLREDARRTVKDIGDHVYLTSAPVKRRIERMEAEGVILGYTVRLGQMGPALEAVIELRYAGHRDQDDILDSLTSVPEVQAAFTTTGDVDALVHIRAEDISHLGRIISEIRRLETPMDSRTLIVLRRRVGQALHQSL